VNATPEPARSRRKQHAPRPKERAPRRAKQHASGKERAPRRRLRDRAGIIPLVLVSIALFVVVVISFIRLQGRLDTARRDACSMATNVVASPAASRFTLDDARRDVARYCPR